MCGITGFFNVKGAERHAKNAIASVSYRGRDAKGFFGKNTCSLGHCLHAMNNKVPQPLKNDDFAFVTNCEIYNWEKIDAKAKNDSTALFNFLAKSNDLLHSLNQLDGVYAFALWNTKISKVFLARDLIGIKPLWYYFDKKTREFAFASERKALIKEELDKANIRELNPRKMLIYDINSKELTEIKREFFEIYETVMEDDKIISYTKNLLEEAIRKRIPKGQKVGILFSGGIDSTFIALMLKNLGVDFTCYTAALDEPTLKDSQDLLWAKKAAKELNLKLEIETVKLSDVPNLLKEILPLIEDNNVVKAGVALPFFLAARKAKKNGVKILFSGLGSEEIFAGYERHKNSLNINEECLSGLRRMYERDLYRDDVITMYHTIELRLPFLDKKLVEFALSVPARLKLNELENKILLRRISEKIGMPKEFFERKKKAAQYGSLFDKALEKLSKKEKLSKSQYLKKFYDEGNVRLGVLLSTGKDSLLAAQIMLEQNYKISCFITINSKNPDSFMYHGPNTHLAKLQAKAANISLIEKKTKGEKEDELKELKDAIKEAVDKYKIEGIVTGALFSNYQRKRIEKICDEIGVKCYSPLWHMDQEKEVKMLLDKKFRFWLVKVAAEGLDSSWLGKDFSNEHLKKLKDSNKKIGLNIAGEGGEYESLVLKAPFFEKKIDIVKFRIEKDGSCATLIVEDTKLI